MLWSGGRAMGPTPHGIRSFRSQTCAPARFDRLRDDHDMTINKLWLMTIGAALLLVGTIVAQEDSWADLLPPGGEARETVINACGGCHSVRITVVARKSKE